jgi:L-threonylcarbamoyladenylate synthase
VITRPDNQKTRRLAAEIVSNGGLIAFRTDTFYGLGADPFNGAAVARIKEVKGREEGKPILLLISDIADGREVIRSRPPLFEILTEAFWPGPLTIVVPASDKLPEEVTAGEWTVGVRLPNDERVLRLVRECGGRLTATSANPSGCEPAESAADVEKYFSTGLDLIIDGGEVTATKASTVMDITFDPPRIIREGAISRAELEAVVGKVI